jgi:trehalose 6-phosphate synthase
VEARLPANLIRLRQARESGAAEELGDALIVNPYDIESVADALQRALTMPLEERKTRYHAMMEVLRRNDISVWRENFVTALAGAPYNS